MSLEDDIAKAWILPKRRWYVNRKLRAKKKEAVSLNWRIRSTADGGDTYYTDMYIPGSSSWLAAVPDKKEGEIEYYARWVDFYFMARDFRKSGLFFNTTMVTAGNNIAERIISNAYDKAHEMLTEEEEALHNKVSRPTFVPAGKHNGQLAYTLERKKKPRFKSLGGVTVDKYQADYLGRRLEDLGNEISFERATKDIAYEYGVGLKLIVDEVKLTEDIIKQKIEEFRARGEENFTRTVDIKPHIPCIKTCLLAEIHMLENSNRASLGIKEEEFDFSKLDDSMSPHFHNGSMAVKGF